MGLLMSILTYIILYNSINLKLKIEFLEIFEKIKFSFLEILYLCIPTSLVSIISSFLTLGLGIPLVPLILLLKSLKSFFMVTIISATQRKSKDGKAFMALTLQGDVEMIQSQTTGKFFLTAKKVSIPSTFDEVMAQTLIGTTMKGTIERVECDPYEYVVPSTGEVMTLAHTYEYRPESVTNRPIPQPQRV